MLLLLLLIKCSYSYFYDGISSLKSIRANLYNVCTKKAIKNVQKQNYLCIIHKCIHFGKTVLNMVSASVNQEKAPLISKRLFLPFFQCL